MPWLQYELCYAHGYGVKEYLEFEEGKLTREDAQAYVIDTYSDGMRRPRFTVLEHLPPKTLERMILDMEEERSSLTERIMQLKAQRR